MLIRIKNNIDYIKNLLFNKNKLSDKDIKIELPHFKVVSTLSVAPQEIPYGVRLIGAELEWSETQGDGIKVAVLDTGIATHPDLKIYGNYDATGHGLNVTNGHGTHCAGIVAANGKIKGVAPKAHLYNVKIIDSNGKIFESYITKALQWCLDNNIEVISMSFGGPTPMPNAYKVIQQLWAKGVILVAAAGNFGLDFPKMYPACYDEVISVGAVDIDRVHADWSSWHETVELTSAGVEVYSTWLNNQYASLNGTSMACPHISGAVAIIISKLRKRGLPVNHEMIRNCMALYADDLGEPGRDIKYGYGVFSFGRIMKSENILPEPIIGIKQMDVAPFIKDSRTFVPLRFMSEELGGKVDWNSILQKATVNFPDRVIELWINQKQYNVSKK